MDIPAIANFELAQNIIKNYDKDRLEVESIYETANAFWQCYTVLLDEAQTDGSNFEISDFKIAFSTVKSAVEKIGTGPKLVDFSLIPTYLSEYVKKIASKIKSNNCDFTIENCSLLFSEDSQHDIDLNVISSVLQKLYLTVVLTILQNIAGNDIFSLINKCVVFDHLGNQAYSYLEFVGLLKRATEKASSKAFDSKKKLDVYLYLGMLNYRLNNYKEAIRFLQKYAEGLIEEKNIVDIDVETKQKLVPVFISIAYSYEKIDTPESINKAISILEAIKENRPIKTFNSDTSFSSIYGKTSDCVNGQAFVNYDSSDTNIKIEIYHALAHFYNERAVFYSNVELTSTEEDKRKYKEDIMKSRDYISIAKSMDNDNAFHSCHGLICFENNDYYRALEIYKEALSINDVFLNDTLKYELKYYLAQSKSAIGKDDDADEDWKEFEEFCSSTNNEDAITQSLIVKTKAKLSNLMLFGKPMEYFKKLLDEILEHKLSKYIPKSVTDERERIILALNTFYALRSIIDKKSSFIDGIEEAFYNLGKYLEKIKKRKNTYSNFIFEPKWILSNKDGDGGKSFRKASQAELFIIEYHSLQIACFGDYRSLMDSRYKVSFRGRFKSSYENKIIEQIQSNKHVDVIILTLTKDLMTDPSRNDILKDIVTSRVCIIALGNDSEDIAKKVNKRGFDSSPVFITNDKNEALQMAFSFGIYELMRRYLIAPIPMLGLAPLIDSKSYSFQAGERLPNLLKPPGILTSTEKQQNDILCDIVNKLDFIQQKEHRKNRYPTEHGITLAYYLKLLEGRDDVSLMAFFIEHSIEDAVLHTLPYKVLQDTLLKENIDYICPSEEGRPYDLTSLFKGIEGFDDVGACILTARGSGMFCDEDLCPAKGCKSFCIGLKETSDNAKYVKKLLQNLFSIKEIKKNVHCICTYVQHKNASGILLIITNYEDSKTDGLREICQLIHGYSQISKSKIEKNDAIKTIHDNKKGNNKKLKNKSKGSNPEPTTKNTIFKIGVSFCGEHRKSIIESVLDELLSHGYTKNDIFYDEWHPHLLSRVGYADVDAKEIYEKKCNFVVVFLSEEYNKKPWTGGIEWEAIRRIINEKERANSVCLLRIDGVDLKKIDGLSPLTSFALDIRHRTPSEIIKHILNCIHNKNTKDENNV